MPNPEVKLYPISKSAKKGKQNAFQVYYKSKGMKKPYRKTFSGDTDEGTARERAEAHQEEIQNRLNKEGYEGLKLGIEHRAEYLAAVKRCRVLGISLSEAVDIAEKWIPKKKSLERGVNKLLDEFIEAKMGRNRATRTTNTLRDRISSFIDGERILYLYDLTPEAIESWISRPGVSARTGYNDFSAIRNWVNWLRKKKYLDADLISHCEEPIPEDPDPRVLTPKQAQELMKHAAKVYEGRGVLRFALMLYAGLRPTEIDKLPMENIRLSGDESGIRITRGKQRKGSKRVRFIKMQPILREYFRVFKHCGVSYVPSWRKVFDEARRDAGLYDDWQEDICRHSFISHRLAECKDIKLVAYESGNSEGVIHSHYLELVTRKDALAYFKKRKLAV